MWISYTVKQAQSHTAHRTESAPERVVRFWTDLLAWSQSLETEGPMSFYQVTPSLRAIHSDAADGFNETASVRINIRIPPAYGMDRISEKLKELAGEGDLQVEDGVNAFRAEKNTFVVRAMLNAVRQVGGVPNFTLKTGTADMNIVAPAWGCPALAYGPGDSSLDHTPNEHISVSEYLKGIEVLSTALKLMMG
jgi:LysW-gamma-L-lysine carboxypeptidase